MSKLIEWLNKQLEKSQHELQCREDAVKAWSGSDAEWGSLPGAPPKQERTATAERESRIAEKTREDINHINGLIAIVSGEEKQALDELRELGDECDGLFALIPNGFGDGDCWDVVRVAYEYEGYEDLVVSRGLTPLAAVRAAAEKLRGAEVTKANAGGERQNTVRVEGGPGALQRIQAAMNGNPAKQSKYRNRPVTTDEGRFDSEKEYDRWCELKILRQAGAIKLLERQVHYPIYVNTHLIGEYVADFAYNENGLLVVEDVKSKATAAIPLYGWKKKLMKAIYGIEIKEV